MLEDMRATIADARMHVLVSHPEPDPGDLGGGFLGNIEVHVHVLVVDRSSYRNLQDAMAHTCLASPHAANFLEHRSCTNSKQKLPFQKVWALKKNPEWFEKSSEYKQFAQITIPILDAVLK